MNFNFQLHRFWKLLAAVIVVSLKAEPSVRAAVLEAGAGKPYSTINSAIAASAAGDVIMVQPGVYAEVVDCSKRGLSVIGVVNSGVRPVIQGKITASAADLTFANLDVTR